MRTVEVSGPLGVEHRAFDVMADSPLAQRLRPHLRDGEMLIQTLGGECHVIQTHVPSRSKSEPCSSRLEQEV